jgi:hypothetical protein
LPLGGPLGSLGPLRAEPGHNLEGLYLAVRDVFFFVRPLALGPDNLASLANRAKLCMPLARRWRRPGTVKPFWEALHAAIAAPLGR